MTGDHVKIMLNLPLSTQPINIVWSQTENWMHNPTLQDLVQDKSSLTLEAGDEDEQNVTAKRRDTTAGL